MRKISATLLCVLTTASFICGAERYIRYNHCGYLPSQAKRAVVMSDENCQGQAWSLKDAKGVIIASATLGESVFGKGDFTPCKYNHEIDLSAAKAEGDYSLEVAGVKPVTIAVKKDPYRAVVQSNLHFLRAQRSGSKDCVDHQPSHFGDSACYIFTRKGSANTDEWVENAKARQADMLGGWYDGYIYTKFTTTNAYTTYFLLRAYELNPALFTKKNSASGLVDILDEAKFGLDYLLKTMPDDSTFIIQVGGYADNENGCRLPNEDELNGKRECYAIISTPQMGLTAAALALGGAVFKAAGQTRDAEKYAAAAKKIYAVAVKHDNTDPAWLEMDYELCKDETKYDNLCLAASELFRLTGEQSFLDKAKDYDNRAKAAGWVSYADLHMTAHLRLLESNPNAKKYLTEDLKEFNETATGMGNLWRQPVDFTFGTVYSSMEAGAAALAYQLATSDKKFEKLGQGVIDYIFGLNNWGVSFVAAPSVPDAIRNIYSQIYLLQTRLYPEGAIAIGPCDIETHDGESKWCYFDPTSQPCYRFNTSKAKFFDHSDDYMCMDATCYGAADGIYLLSLASKLWGGK
jgi:hypothetical protein